ncbi:hypothetical protein KUTeg_012643 [Tegillarca granosa]|uniref:Uncharacterized protein n=1 Tax=Tegillarca granosa TaxID=220873 RepID=A0ABQ9F055_TEGGR|nr:hypothetical protein KUTeg_012643 [Tegillarca granosa]
MFRRYKMYQGGSMNRRRSQSSQNQTADLYDPFEAQNEQYEQNLGYNASRGGRSYDNYGMTTGSRKRQASLENYGNTKQQRMGMDDLRSTTETEQLLKMLVEQNKLIKKQQEIIESRGGLNMSKDQSEIRGSHGNNSGRDHFSSGSNIWDDTDYGQSDLRSSSFESFQDKSRGQDYLTSNYSDSGSRSFDSSRGNMQRNLGYLYEDTNRSSSAAPYVKSVPISQLKELNKYQKNKKEHQKKSAAQSQAWGQKSPKGQGQKGYLNNDKGYGSFSKSSDLPKKSMLKNRMQRSTTTNNQQDEIWGTGTTNKMYEESEAYYQKTGTASYDYKHGQRESDSFYNTEGSYKVPDQHHFKKQQLKSSTNKSGKNRGSEYFEGNPTYDQDGFLISSNLSSLRMQNEQRNSYDDFEYMSNTMSSRKSLERKDFDSSGRSSQQEYPRSLNQQRKRFFQRDSDTGQSYDSFGQSQYSGHQNIDNFERDSSLSYPEEYQNNQYGSERQGQSMMYRSGQSRGFQKEDTNLNYQNISQQSDVFSSDTICGNLPPRKEMSQSFSNQMQKHQQLPFMNRQKSSLSMDSGLEQGSFQAFGSLMQTSPHLMDRERSRSQMDSFKDCYTDGGQNIFRSRNQRGGFEESYGDGMQKAPNSQMQTSPRFSDPYQSSLLAKSSHQSLTMTGPNRRNKGDQRPTNQRDQRSRLKNQGKNKPSRNSVAMSNSKKPVTVQTFFRNKYNKLRQTASAKNIQSKSNLIRDNKTEPPKAEFLSDLFSSRKSRRQARGNSLNTKNVNVEKTTESHSPRPSTTLSRLTPKTTKLPPNITNVGYFHNRTRGLASALDTSKQVDTLVKDENMGKKR